MGAGTGTTGPGRRVSGTGKAGTGWTDFFSNNGVRSVSNPYPCTRQYPGTDTGTSGNGYGPGKTGNTRSGFSKCLLVNHFQFLHLLVYFEL